MTTTSRRPWWGLAAFSGAVAAGAFLAVAELMTLLVPGAASPLETVGAFVIDIVPQPVTAFAISVLGSANKPVLLGSLALAAAVGAGIAGIVDLVRPPFGRLLFGAVVVAIATIALTRAGSGPLDVLPAAAGGVAVIAFLGISIRMLRRWRDAETAPSETDAAVSAEPRGTTGRRSFLRLTIVAAASAAVIGIGARVAAGTTASITAIREALRLPTPRSRVAIPAGAELDIPGISPLFTPNDDFYRVDTALVVPEVDPASWRLVIDGMVDRPIELTFDDLLARGLDEYAVTLTCVSNEVGGGLVGNALWQGVPVRELLRMAGPAADADMVLSRSVDGYTASTPIEALTDDGLDAILAVAMNGEPLPAQHGFPVRMVVPGLYGYVSATKWLTRLTVTRFDRDEAYWTPRGYSDRAPIKMSSRIDTPRVDTPVEPGAVAIAGVAWAQPVGIGRVEVQIDDEDWREATLSSPISADTWVQWMLPWEATPGAHNVTVRAYDRNGEQQIEERAPIAPNGSSGWQRSLITVR